MIIDLSKYEGRKVRIWDRFFVVGKTEQSTKHRQLISLWENGRLVKTENPKWIWHSHENFEVYEGEQQQEPVGLTLHEQFTSGMVKAAVLVGGEGDNFPRGRGKRAKGRKNKR